MDEREIEAGGHTDQVDCADCHHAVPNGQAESLGVDLGDSQLRLFRHQYACEGMSVRRIAELCGIRRQRLVPLLRLIGVAVAAGGAGRSRPWTRSPDKPELQETLAHLYTELHLSSVRIGELLGMSDRLVRLRLREFGIRRRPRGRSNREDRHEVDPDVLAQLMVRRDLPGTDVSHQTGEPYAAVLRSAHLLGLPVQLGGPPGPMGQRHIETIEALYGDHLVQDTLRRFDVRIVPAGAALWERFPRPVALTPDLLVALYVRCGLSTTHIELLTGQPTTTVQRWLHEFGVPLRSVGGRAPIWRRWRASAW